MLKYINIKMIITISIFIVIVGCSGSDQTEDNNQIISDITGDWEFTYTSTVDSEGEIIAEPSTLTAKIAQSDSEIVINIGYFNPDGFVGLAGTGFIEENQLNIYCLRYLGEYPVLSESMLECLYDYEGIISDDFLNMSGIIYDYDGDNVTKSETTWVAEKL